MIKLSVFKLSVLRLLLIITGGITFLMLPSLIMAVIQKDFTMTMAFLIPFAAGLVLFLSAVKLIPKTTLGSLNSKDGFLLVFLTWICATLAGCVPYLLAKLDISVIDAIFESACSFATTGATIFTDIESLPRPLLLWRSIGHWSGGIGIILLTVALMPILGVGGFQLIKAEVPGPEKDKLKPKVTDAAKIVLLVYGIFTIILAALYKIGGMDLFDAVCHSFTLISTGGVSTKNNGFAFYNSAFIDWVTVVFMLLGALNFNLYYRIMKGKIKELTHNTETRAFLFIFLAAASVVVLSIIPKHGSLFDALRSEALRVGVFQVASTLSTSGSVRADYSAWPVLAQAVIFSLMFIGGCSGSTAGGIKVIRHTVLLKQALNEVQRILFPKGVFSIRLNRKVGRKDIVYGVAGFIFLYFMVIIITTLVTAASGYDIFSSFSVAVSMTGNVGAGFGAAGPFHNYSEFPAYLKLFYSLVMITGRLELWTVIVLFTPRYWRG